MGKSGASRIEKYAIIVRVSSPRLCIPKNIRVFTFVTSVEHFGRPSTSLRN